MHGVFQNVFLRQWEEDGSPAHRPSAAQWSPDIQPLGPLSWVCSDGSERSWPSPAPRNLSVVLG